MKLISHKIRGLFIIRPRILFDKRGSFRRSFCKKILKKNKIIFNVSQGNLSENMKKGTLRGFHFQKTTNKDAKILTCVRGKALNVTIDIRKKSKTYLTIKKTLLTEKNKCSLLVPPGCANAFLTLQNNTVIHYYMNDYYKKNTDEGIRYNDPIVKVRWPLKPKVISDRDLKFKDFIKK
jgi:dTDP-4-dehydrorhamnose 3,5-epimerase